MDNKSPKANGNAYREQIMFVKDRPGHDLRYAIDATKVLNELGWVPEETFETGIVKTVDWYLANQNWCRQIEDGSYQQAWLAIQKTKIAEKR